MGTLKIKHQGKTYTYLADRGQTYSNLKYYNITYKTSYGYHTQDVSYNVADHTTLDVTYIPDKEPQHIDTWYEYEDGGDNI